MPAAECLELIHDDVAKFDDMLANPAIFSGNSPDWDAEDYIGLHESFYLLEPMEERWGKWASWKCMCESFCRILPCTSAFRSPLILGGWPAARYTQSPCPCLPNPDIMHGSRLAQLVIATTRHAARHHSHRPSSASHHSAWNQRPRPSPRYVIYASTVHDSQLLSLYVCMQARVTRASTELLPA
jgi:hypothetical protein